MIKLKIKYGNSQTDLRFPCTEKEMNPPIIEQATYEKMQKTKHGRNTQRNTDKTRDMS